MISLSPTSRQTFSSYLSSNQSLAFPSSFYAFLHPFTTSLSSTSSPTASRTNPNASTGTVTGMNELNTGAIQLTTAADDIVERIWGEWELIRSYLEEESQVAKEKEGVETEEDGREGVQETKSQPSDVSDICCVFFTKFSDADGAILRRPSFRSNCICQVWKLIL